MLELAEVLRRFGDGYRERYGARMPPSHRRAMDDIESCRTAALGGHLWRCQADGCPGERWAYHSCRNRSCPKCHREQTSRWLSALRNRLPGCRYFLITLTLPSELRGLAKSNQRDVLGALARAAVAALLKLTSDPAFLGARPAILAVIHTWTQDLHYHPHVHLLVTAGGLDGEGRWVRPRHPEYLVPAKALAEIFRAKMAAALRRVRLLSQAPLAVWKKPWVVQCQHAGDGERVLEYLARYVFRVAITNSRIVAIEDAGVTFRVRNRKSGATELRTLPPLQFISQFLQHVLPKGFVKVRSCGLLAPRNRGLLAQARAQLDGSLAEACSPTAPPPTAPPPTASDVSEASGAPPSPLLCCPVCHLATMRQAQRLPPRRGPP